MEFLPFLLVVAWVVLVPLALVVQNLLLRNRIDRLETRIDRLARPAEAEASEPLSSAPEHESLGGLFERLLAGRLLIWLGGIALVLAAVFLIRYSIEIGLVTPGGRMLAAALFGFALLALGELAHARLGDDPRIAQALVGAGVAVLYATAYGAHVLYALIDVAAAAGAMFAVTAAALLLSFRHGPPAAATGLIGGFLTPILLGDPDVGALPLLAYIALLDTALFAVAWRRGWGWLAAAAVLLSFAWTGSLITGPPTDARLAGMFVVILGTIAAFIRPGDGRQVQLVQPLAIGLFELAFLVVRSDPGGEAWLLYGMLAAASLALAAPKAEVQLAPPLALGLALALLLAQALTGEDAMLPAAGIGMTALFGGAGLVLTQRHGGLFWAGITAAGLAGPALCLRAARPELLMLAGWGLVFAILALAAGALVWLLRARTPRTRADALALLAAGAGVAVLAAAATRDLVSGDLVTVGWLALAIAFIAAGIRLPEKALRLAGLLLLTATILKAFLVDAAALEGLPRILSFLGLGLALIGIGRAYGPVLRAERS
ncbi:MAG TPA: DUF2339 domain-containing protein [Allosphingosinicella sp.]|nr:DUF2339 domain-containing protein [Allosphingosinicella sp.]